MSKFSSLALKRCQSGFSLAEILICLALVGFLSALAVPLMLNGMKTDKSSQYNASARNVAFMMTNAYERFKSASPGTTQISVSDLTPYFQYVSTQASGYIDNLEGTSSGIDCSSWNNLCIKLHNGGVIHHWGDSFCSSTNTAIPFDFDPDGVDSGQLTGPSKSIRIWLYSDGRVRSGANMIASTQWSSCRPCGCMYTRSSDPDPTWFTGF